MNRRAAFTPLHHPHCERPRIIPSSPDQHTLKRNKFRAPIPAVPTTQQKPVERLVERILAAKQKNPAADTSALEREIDQQVYALYGQRPEEIKIVEDASE